LVGRPLFIQGTVDLVIEDLASVFVGFYDCELVVGTCHCVDARNTQVEVDCGSLFLKFRDLTEHEPVLVCQCHQREPVAIEGLDLGSSEREKESK